MIRSLILLISLFLALPAFAAVNLKSAIREPGKSYLGYKYVASLFSQNPMTDAPSSKAAVDSSTPYADERSLPAVTQWESVAVMNERFAKFRDVRWLQSSDQPGFLRRSSWLFPDDGCFARAGLAILNLNKWKMPVPSKIFV
ncbi:MAG: hypothetical protein ACXVA9_06350, partial [Bdellovibrionales bacterium]